MSRNFNNPSEFVRQVCERPGMWVYKAQYYSVAALLSGYDICCGELGLYPGFHDWLVTKLGQQSNPMVWPRLVLAVFLGHELLYEEEFPPELEGEAIKKLGDLLLEYLSERNGSD